MSTFLLGVCAGIWLMVFADWYDSTKGGMTKNENNDINKF